MVRFSLLALLFVSTTAVAQTIPRWEAGAGLFALHIPYYRGAAEGHNLVFPYPLFRFRGEKYSVDSNDSAKRWFYVSDRLNVHMSLGWGLPVPKGSSGARKDLGGLPPSLEFGPKASIKLLGKGKHSLALKVPVRVGFAADFSGVYYQGWLTTPYLYYLFQNWEQGRLRLAIASGVRYGNQDYHDFYYSVPDTYQASAGNGGWWNSLAVYKEFGPVELSVYFRYDLLERATFADSPLVETKRYFATGGVLTWWFAKSKYRVHTDQREAY